MATVSVIGCGYLGAVHAAAMATFGHDVVGVDVAADKVADLNAGVAPFHEPGFPELLQAALRSGRLRFSTDPSAAAGADAHFLCVGTPQRPGVQAFDLSPMDAAVDGLLPHLRPDAVVIGKSTVPVGTEDGIARKVAAAAPGALVAWNPEFLREGRAVQDSLEPDRLVYGLPDGADGERARKVLDDLYRPVVERGTPCVTANLPTAELTKTAANAFLATKISFINAMAELCEATDADVTVLAQALGHDVRIGPQFLRAGLGFGGGCLPKDIRGFMARAEELGVEQAVSFLREIDAIDLRRRSRMVDLATESLGGAVRGRRIALLGTAFKPGSDDIRDSPALAVAQTLVQRGADVVATDPAAIANSRRALPSLSFADTSMEAAVGAELVMVLTEWPEFKALDPARLAEVTAARKVLDGRNALDPQRWRRAGWTYRALGRR